MKFMDYHVFSGCGWVMSMVLGFARFVYQTLLTPSTYRAVFTSPVILGFHAVAAFFITWIIAHSASRSQSKASVSEFIWVIFTAIVNGLSHVCTAERDMDSELATEEYTSDAFIRSVGVVMFLSLLGTFQFTAGWVYSQIKDPSSFLRSNLCWKPANDEWKLNHWYEWAISYYNSSWPRTCVFSFTVGGIGVLIISVLTTPVSADNNNLLLVLLAFGGILAGIHLTVFDVKYFNIAAHKSIVTDLQYASKQTNADVLSVLLPSNVVEWIAVEYPSLLEGETPAIDFKVKGPIAVASNQMHIVSAIFCAIMLVSHAVLDAYFAEGEIAVVKSMAAAVSLSGLIGYIITNKWIFEWMMFGGDAFFLFTMTLRGQAQLALPFLLFFIVALAIIQCFGRLLGSGALIASFQTYVKIVTVRMHYIACVSENTTGIKYLVSLHISRKVLILCLALKLCQRWSPASYDFDTFISMHHEICIGVVTCL
jgi:hypothetical protein